MFFFINVLTWQWDYNSNTNNSKLYIFKLWFLGLKDAWTKYSSDNCIDQIRPEKSFPIWNTLIRWLHFYYFIFLFYFKSIINKDSIRIWPYYEKKRINRRVKISYLTSYFAVQINWLVSIWGQHWHLMGWTKKSVITIKIDHESINHQLTEGKEIISIVFFLAISPSSE